MSAEIVVAGDVSIDWYYWPRPPSNNREDLNWKLYEGISTAPQCGGAALLSQMISNNLQNRTENSLYSVVSHDFKDLFKKSPNEVLHTNIELDLFPLLPCGNQRKEVKSYSAFPCNHQKKEDRTYRVKRHLGYTTPNDKALCENSEWYPAPLKILDDKEGADFVIIYDSGNGFRKRNSNCSESWPESWPKALKKEETEKPIVIYNMYPPLFQGDLWDHIIKYHYEKLILVLNADDLRKMGINISRSISWEKSAIEFLWEINNNPKLEKIKELRNLIVRFNFEGAIHYHKEKEEESRLYFDPSSVEGSFWNSRTFGSMKAVTLVFLATLSSCLISKYEEDKDYQTHLGDSIKESLVKSREFLVKGYGNKNGKPEFFKQSTTESQNNPEHEIMKLSTDSIICTSLPKAEKVQKDGLIKKENKEEKDEECPYFWTILQEKTEEGRCEKGEIKLKNLTCKIVKEGVSAIECFPVGNFGKLTTVDRAEIESFRSIMNVMEEYLHSEKNQKPLSVAVFGSPGSGKSFGITEVAKSIDSEKIVTITFNISQFTTINHLTHAFHRIRDISLEGKIPLVFFDEFDSKFEDEELGWIKYFLVPMQDGKFMDCENMHPIGKSIFVFAGGTCCTFRDFCKLCGCDYETEDTPPKKLCKIVSNNTEGEPHGKNTSKSLSNKCPDFLSRLRGYVNILGPNRIENENDEAYTIRRAILLRSLIEDYAPKIIDSNGIVNIDDKLLKALINVPEYTHGVRSLQAIVEMSMLREENSWQKAFLPPKDQLKLHIKDVKEFYEFLAQDERT